MKNTHSIITTFITFLLSPNLLANEIEIAGELRSIYDYGKTRNGQAIGGHVGLNYRFSSDMFNSFKVRTAVYTSQPFIGSRNGISGTGLVEGHHGFTLIGEANVNLTTDKHNITIGRQLISSPLVTSHDAILVQGMFSGVNYSTSILENNKLNFMFLNEMSGRDNLHKKSEWLSMSKILGASYKEGMYAIGINNKSIIGLEAQVWNYSIANTLNTFYVSTKFKKRNSNYQYETHYWRSKSKNNFELDTGTKIDYHFYGMQVSRSINQFTFKLAYDRMNKKLGSFTLPKAFGNYAIYTYGLRIDSGAYGANIKGTGLNITSMEAVKFTSVYKMAKQAVLIVGYMVGKSSDHSLQSDMNVLDIAWFSGKSLDEHFNLGVVLENLSATGTGVFKSDTKLKLIAKYQF